MAGILNSNLAQQKYSDNLSNTNPNISGNFYNTNGSGTTTNTLLVGNQSFKEEFYKVFFNYMINDLTLTIASKNPNTDGNSHTLDTAPFSIFDRSSSEPPAKPVLYSTSPKNDTGGGSNDSNGIKGGGNFNNNDATFINNNRGFFTSPSQQANVKVGITAMAASNRNVKQLRTDNLIITNYFLQNHPNNTTNNPTILADSASISKMFYQETENTQKQMFDLSIRNICNVFSPNGSLINMSLIPSDFAFIKDINMKSNNKLVVLRRYPYPVGNNPLLSQDINKKPISTLLGYVEGESWISINLGENWKKVENPNLNKLFKNEGGGILTSLFAAFGDAAFNQALRATNLKDSNAAFNIAADPNLIVESHRRDDGLKNEVKIEFKTVYQIKYYPGIDIETIFLDIMANIFTMSTSDRISLMTPQDGTTLENVRNLLNASNKDKLFSDAVSFLKSLISNINTFVTNTDTSTADNSATSQKKDQLLATIKNKILSTEYDQLVSFLSSAQNAAVSGANAALDSMFSKYELPIKGTISALFGVENAPWHVTIGNPMRPLVSIGNLVLSSATVELKGSSNLADIPSEIHFKCSLEPAIPLGKQDLEAIFNAGIGRIYNNYLGKQPQNYGRDYNYTGPTK